MELQPRHYRLIEYLEANPKKKFGVDELAKALSLSMPVIRNEIPKLCALGYVKRKPCGRSFEYYAANQTPPATFTKAKPFNARELLAAIPTIANSSYTPKLAKLAWNYPLAILDLVSSALQGQHTTCRQTILATLEATEAYSMALRRVLSTPQLWDDRLSDWLTEGLLEKDLEKLAELTRQGLAAHGRLEPQAQQPRE